MANLVEINQIGKREDLRDFISIVDMKEKPLLGMLPQLESPGNMTISWQADKYATPILTGVADGEDVGNFENVAKDRAALSVYAQKVRRTAMVGDIAENVSNVAGAKAGELARALEKQQEVIQRDIEAILGSDNDTQLETGSLTPYETRGLGSWIASSAQTVLPVPAAFLTPSASIRADAASSTTEAEFNGVLASVFAEYGKRQTLDLVIGTDGKTMISAYVGAAQTQYNLSGANKVVQNVTTYEGDFNTVQIHSTLLNAMNSSTANVKEGRGYLIPSETFGVAWSRTPRVKPLEDQGGGPRAYIDAIFACICRNPRASGKLAPTS